MRFFYVLILAILTILEVGPIPITPIFLIYVVLFRPVWFYQLILKIYDNN